MGETMTKKTDKELPLFIKMHKDISEAFDEAHAMLEEVSQDNLYNHHTIIEALGALDTQLSLARKAVVNLQDKVIASEAAKKSMVQNVRYLIKVDA